MAYTQLLLSAGGGIISLNQQADQEPNTATILIGLGGTGVHCLRTVKSQVYTRLKPDKEDAVISEYKRIRFLGVDTTTKSKGGELNQEGNGQGIGGLKDTEFFSIENAELKGLVDATALKHRPEYAWFEGEK
ncbi:hypothetical protein P261_00368 [Lachnospiraceae bacterium TWA4]|nr:hypothetical protein P261_00368 [Lachnospiraceae bacterium TWA4]